MNRLKKIIEQNLLASKETPRKALRIFHGRGRKWEGLEHLTIDYFPPHILVTLYKESSEIFIKEIVSTLKEIPELQVESLLLQKRYLSRPEIIELEGFIPSKAIAEERGSQFNLKFGDVQNIGFFLDMAPGRAWLQANSLNKKVLNLFSYTCSLSVAAFKGNASSVVNIDMSKAALAVGESNHLLNEIEMKNVRFLSYDIMKSWNNIFKHGPYDIVVIDPPTNQGESFKVERDYYKIIKRLKEMTNPGASIMACLNSPYLTGQFLKDIFKEHAPEFQFQEIIYSAFSPMETNPEEGLKILIFKK